MSVVDARADVRTIQTSLSRIAAFDACFCQKKQNAPRTLTNLTYNDFDTFYLRSRSSDAT